MYLKNEKYNVWNNEYFTKWTPQWTRGEGRNIQGTFKLRNKSAHYEMKKKKMGGGEEEKIKSMW